VNLEQALGRKDLPFEKLFIDDGAYVDDVSVAQITEFLSGELQAA
jgi:acyl carrier protein